ncbi:SirB2 family protein [Thalassotalea mangrovi]|uniref:SirB family protein n=1 Tax=Thalassotalea mangrovi TaxID=2572245 RepID=A0A4U1B3P2_9GAMM|nr:SirB2 family protein [Thalassotalea mangrovi]TKB44146.1 SirB family protein [Thalassotalea mangrovi]
MELVKSAHFTLAMISILLFSYRFVLLMRNPKKLSQKWLKILPHVIDTILLLTGITLMVSLSLYPGEHDWMLEKLLALVAYIFTGFYTLKWARTDAMKYLGYLGALGWFILIIKLAMTHQTMFL